MNTRRKTLRVPADTSMPGASAVVRASATACTGRAVEGAPESPLGPLVAQAVREGYGGSGGGAPYHGYYYRILEAQGEHAPGGARSYLQDGRMVGGFALVAYPAEYGRSGIMTLIVDSRGLMFQRDLGPETETLAAAIDAYDPGPGWVPVLD